nr:Gag-Pol polyprotein [Tanacetum cinerariifolium]
MDKGDIGVFVGYSKESAAFRIYNKRTRKIHESVNVNFDELSVMASKQFSLEPGLSNLNETGKSSNRSVSKVDEALKNDLEDLFQDLYDEYFDSSKVMKSLTTNVETPINEEVFHEILGRPVLSTAHAKIDVFKRKITLRAGEEKIVFKSIKHATSIIRRVYMLRTNLDSKTELIGEVVNKSFNPHYGDYIKLNNLDMPIEPKINQDDNFKPTIDENVIVKHFYKMKFTCMIGYKHVNADLLPTLSINMMTKRFYNSMIKDEGDHAGKDLVGTLIDMHIFVGNFSSISGFTIIDDMDELSSVVLGMPFCKKFISCQKIMEKFARMDECE